VATKGFYDIRPMGGIEVPLPFGPDDSLLPAMWVFGFPFNIYVGGEYTLYLRRLQLRPQAGVGFGMIVPWLIDTEEPIFTHIGGFVGVKLSWLFNRDTAFSVDLGYKAWFGVYDAIFDTFDIERDTMTYSGVRLAAGVSRKL
jgi:hypothetical protein